MSVPSRRVPRLHRGLNSATLWCFRKDSYHHLTSDCEKGGAYHTFFSCQLVGDAMWLA